MNREATKIIVSEGRRGCLDSGVGWFCLIFGLGLPLMAFFGEDGAQGLLQLPTFLLFGAPFVWAGTLLLFRRARMHIDLEAGLLVSSSKYLWFPEKENRTPLALFESVTVADKRVSTGKTRRTYRSVFLVSSEPLSGIQESVSKSEGFLQSSVELFRFRSDEDAKRRGEKLAEQLSLPLVVKDGSLPR